MLDPQWIRNDLDQIAAALKKRNMTLDVAAIRTLEEKRKALQVTTEQLRAERNAKSKEVGRLKARGEAAQAVTDAVVAIKKRLEQGAAELDKVQAELDDILSGIPNIPHDSVPAGESEADNEETRRWGEPRRFDFRPRDHVELGENLTLIDFETAARIASSRFVIMHGAIAGLHRALIQFMLDTHTREHGYREVNVPYLVNTESCRGTGQLPKFEQDLFHVKEHGFYLIPTAEVPVTNIARDQIINADELPRKYVCHSPCFRSEAGSYGQDTRGMIRHHQFEKVELVQLVKPQDSYRALEELTGQAEVILQKLALPYRVVTLCGADIGFAAAKTYDLEVWLPGQNKYREISSCSNFEAFQARRMKARWRNPETNRPELLHTLNGSGLAVGRALIAVMENYQDRDGNITIPAVLRPYMSDQATISRPETGQG